MKDLSITDKIFSNFTVLTNLYTDEEKWKNFFQKIKPLLQMDDIDLAIKLGDIQLALVIWLGRKKEQYNASYCSYLVNELFDISKKNVQKQTNPKTETITVTCHQIGQQTTNTETVEQLHEERNKKDIGHVHTNTQIHNASHNQPKSYSNKKQKK
jgi:hypothetical protein